MTMSVAKIIKDQTALFANLDKRFSETIKPDTFQSRLTGLTKDQEDRITGRIQKLETQKTAAIAKYDAAISEEKKALEQIKAQRLSTDASTQLKDIKGKTAPVTRKTGTTPQAKTTKKTTTKKATGKPSAQKK
ncbi:MAG: hypothetical protein ABJG80_11060 [Paracoccaceae bacterium]